MSPLYIGDHRSAQLPEWPPDQASYADLLAWQNAYPRRPRAGTVADVAHEIIAEHWTGASFILRVLDGDGRDIWSDHVPAVSPAEMPTAAEARLSGPVPWRVGGEWTRVEDPATGPRWTAPARPVRPDEMR